MHAAQLLIQRTSRPYITTPNGTCEAFHGQDVYPLWSHLVNPRKTGTCPYTTNEPRALCAPAPLDYAMKACQSFRAVLIELTDFKFVARGKVKVAAPEASAPPKSSIAR